jgi:hypothetical protein
MKQTPHSKPLKNHARPQKENKINNKKNKTKKKKKKKKNCRFCIKFEFSLFYHS